MKYREYMDETKLIEEQKSVLFGKLKQRARQLRAARAEKPAPLKAEAAEAAVKESGKRSNPIKLHPMRFAAIFTSIALVLTAIPLLAILLPRGGNVIELKLDYMEDLMVDTEGVTAYSIRRETTEEPMAVNLSADEQKKGPAISFFSDLILEGTGPKPLAKSSKKERTFLYSTTESYEAGNVEYDASGIQKVTFMKNKEVTEDVYDENGELIDSDRRIQQEELDGQINRIYTTGRFTFVQFVPVVDDPEVVFVGENGESISDNVDLRPDELEFDENGSSLYDSDGSWERALYYSNPISASFVIDNTTGYFYKIKDIGIQKFMNGCVVGANVDQRGRFLESPTSIYALAIDANYNLVITDVIPNKDVEIYSAFMENDGWTYVLNNTLDANDPEKKIRYINSDKIFNAYYVKDREGNVYIAAYERPFIYFVTQKFVGGMLVPFENHGLLKLRGLTSFGNAPWSDDKDLHEFCGMYDGLALRRTNMNYWWFEPIASNDDETAGIFNQNAFWWDDNFDILIVDEGILSYKFVDLADYVDKAVTFGEGDLTRLSDFELERVEDYYMSVGKDRYKIENVYRYKGMNETKYYRIVRTETGLGLEELTSKSYEDNVFIFQPINK